MPDTDSPSQDDQTPNAAANAANGAGNGESLSHVEPPTGAPLAARPLASISDDAPPAGADAPGPATGAEVTRSPLRSRKWIWASLAVICLLVGAVASLLGARSLARSDTATARHSFKQGSAAITATVKLGLQHEEDLLASAGTYFAGNPIASRTEFAVWAEWARTLRNHPDLDSLGLISLVRSPQLGELESRLARSAKKPALAHLRITPRSTSATHCLAIATLSRGPAVSPAPGLDYCARNAGLLTTRDTALSSFTPVALATGAGLEVQTPVYRGGAAPSTGAGRRGAFVGWLRELLTPGVLLSQALHGHSGYALRLHHRTRTTDPLFLSGAHSSGAQSASSDLPNGWTLQSFGATLNTGVLGDSDALGLLIGGLLASILLALLVLSLSRGTRHRPAPAPVQPEPNQQPREDLYDALTGLPNRALTLDRAERMLARAGRQSGIMVGALFIDIDWFKDVNDKLGQAAGDHVLKIVSQRLEQVLRAHDTVGRYGGDEFVLLVESAARGMRLDSLARRVIEALHKPVEIEGFGPSFCLTASIGVAFGRYATSEDLLRDAHMALIAAKAAGKDRYTLFNANMRSVIEGRGVLEADLNAALQDNHFSLLYQPIVDLSTRRAVAVEALIRWQHPTKGEVSPADFIPMAEESGQIVPIGRWMLEEACTRMAALGVAGHRVAAAVKVYPSQLNRDGFTTDVLRALQQSGLEPSLLVLEIAETTVMADAAAAAKRLDELKQLGVRIAIDDFGTGYAYRSDLQRMPIDFLKVDRGSLASSEDEDYRSWLLEAILVFGRDLSLTVVAKGVENQEQMAVLQEMGCKMAQGPVVSEPIPAETIESFLQAQANHPEGFHSASR